MNEKITVRIIATQEFVFDQEVEMTQEQWAEIKSTDRRRMEDGGMSPLTTWLDLSDPMDFKDFDDLDIEVVGDEGEPVQPEDYWGQDA